MGRGANPCLCQLGAGCLAPPPPPRQRKAPQPQTLFSGLVNRRLASANSLRSQLPNARRPVQNWQLWAVAAALSAAITALLVKVGVQGVDAGMATLFRTLAVAIVLALVLLVSGRLDWQELRQLPALSLGALALSALATGVSWFCYSRALQLGPVAGVAALDKLSVVLIALLALLLLGEQLDLKAWLGVVLMAIGAALVAWV